MQRRPQSAYHIKSMLSTWEALKYSLLNSIFVNIVDALDRDTPKMWPAHSVHPSGSAAVRAAITIRQAGAQPTTNQLEPMACMPSDLLHGRVATTEHRFRQIKPIAGCCESARMGPTGKSQYTRSAVWAWACDICIYYIIYIHMPCPEAEVVHRRGYTAYNQSQRKQIEFRSYPIDLWDLLAAESKTVWLASLRMALRESLYRHSSLVICNDAMRYLR